MNKAEYLLTCLMEECAEVQQSASKSLRFGLEDHHPDRETTNEKELITEIHHIIAVAEMLTTEGVISYIKPEEALEIKNRKKLNLVKYMRVSRQSGKLT